MKLSKSYIDQLKDKLEWSSIESEELLHEYDDSIYYKDLIKKIDFQFKEQNFIDKCPEGYEYVRPHYNKNRTFIDAFCRKKKH